MSLDQVEVLENKKRERKSMSRFTYEEGESKEEKKGSGIALGELSELEANFNDKKYADILVTLHLLVYKSKGKAGQQKKKLKTFTGLVYGDDPATDRLRYEERANKLKRADIEKMMSLLKIDKSKASFNNNIPSKEMLVTRLIDYLEEPTSQAKKKKSEATSSKKRKSSSGRAKNSQSYSALEEACLQSIAKKTLEDDSDMSPSALIKACESFIGTKLPNYAKSVVKSIIEEDDQDEQPPPKKSKKKAAATPPPAEEEEEEEEEEAEEDDDDDEEEADNDDENEADNDEEEADEEDGPIVDDDNAQLEEGDDNAFVGEEPEMEEEEEDNNDGDGDDAAAAAMDEDD